MSRSISDLINVLKTILRDYARMADLVQQQQTAMRALDQSAMERLHADQDRLRIQLSQLENRRKNSLSAVARAYKLSVMPTLAQVADLEPAHRQEILQLRDDLQRVTQELANRWLMVLRLAGALLGHLNSAVKLLAGATQQAGTYTRQGGTMLSGRIGVVDAVG